MHACMHAYIHTLLVEVGLIRGSYVDLISTIRKHASASMQLERINISWLKKLVYKKNKQWYTLYTIRPTSTLNT